MLALPQVTVGDRLPELHHDVTATTVVLGAVASRDWRPMHHDHDFAVNRNGTQDIFLNTPNQAAWLERFITDWTGPTGRLGRLTFRMKASVFPGDRMTFAGTVTGTRTDASGCGWVDLDITLSATSPGGSQRVATTCRASVAVPTAPGDNPWDRRGDRWRPEGPKD